MFTSGSRVVHNTHISLKNLNTAELFVVSSLRLWMLPHYDQEHWYPDWRAGFARARIDSDGELGFHIFCEMLAAGRLEPLRVRALLCPRLGEDEAWPLRIVGLLQQDQLTGAQSILTQHCAASAGRLALAPARDFARALLKQQLWVTCHFDNPCAATPRGVGVFESTRVH
jgi:hypothetical protein